MQSQIRENREKSKSKIGDGTLEQCEEFYLSLDLMKQNQYIHICKNRSAAFYKIGDEPDSDKNNSDYQNEFSEWDEKLNEFKIQNGWDKFSN